jgi:hypothetical protein
VSEAQNLPSAEVPPVLGRAQQRAVAVAPGFQENEQIVGHINPVGIRFVRSPGPMRAIVFEKSGRIYYYDDLDAQGNPVQAELIADVSNDTHDFWDRGMLGLANHPNFTETPEIYILYT